MPMVFTSLGISMLSSVLTSDVAIQANIRIMRDQNEINEETALQIELINESIAQLNALQETDKARPKIGFITNYESTPQSKTDK